MNILVTGPTGVGKSTLLLSGEISKFLQSCPVPPNTVFGFQLANGDLPDHAFIHYNLLHPALANPAPDFGAKETPCHLMEDPIFRKIIGDSRLGMAVVLVSPLDELLERAEERTCIERNVEGLPAYDSQCWRSILETTNISAVYEQLFCHLERRGIPYVVVNSSAGIVERFQLSDRVFVPANLRGISQTLPTADQISAIMGMPGCHYQSVLLPHHFVTDKGEYSHIIGGRHESFEAILGDNLWNASVLDIGCALGDLLYRAERLGAARVFGVEPHPARFEAATAIRNILASQAELHNCDFMEMSFDRTFDHVFILNVIHHVKSFDAFLEKACRLAGKTLTIEFPTLKDEKFSSANGHVLAGLLDWLPLIGVSSRSADQTYVFSPKAIKRICMDQIGGFRSVSMLKSPLKGRKIMIFEK